MQHKPASPGAVRTLKSRGDTRRKLKQSSSHTAVTPDECRYQSFSKKADMVNEMDRLLHRLAGRYY